PIVRTSPDHGTAFAIAGQDLANPGAMIAAIDLAVLLATQQLASAAALLAAPLPSTSAK
ncbi:MAG: hypothetical protein RLY72_249, partial [Planctomycetota bacterium]